MRTDPTPVHEHHFNQLHPFQPERDRCECGMFRYEIMGPIARYRVRKGLAAYRESWPIFERR